ncbi:hypothetical protein KGO95_00500 [Patescibacteria group bacterium]|nr:hypothetical protein [Patescibacteria group bacterium]
MKTLLGLPLLVLEKIGERAGKALCALGEHKLKGKGVALGVGDAFKCTRKKCTYETPAVEWPEPGIPLVDPKIEALPPYRP